MHPNDKQLDELMAWVKSLPSDADIRAEERERCARIAETFNKRVSGPGYRDAKLAIAAEIRNLK